MKLKDIVAGKEYPYIECRAVFTHNNEEFDEFFGACSYMNGELKPLDGDTYSLEDEYFKHEEWVSDKDCYDEVSDGEKTNKVLRVKAGDTCLTVWEECETI